MKNWPQEVCDYLCVCVCMCVCVFSVLYKWRRNTHHLRVVGIESLLVQGELLRTEGVVEFNHLRKLQAETSVTVRRRYLSSRGLEKLHLCSKPQGKLHDN